MRTDSRVSTQRLAICLIFGLLAIATHAARAADRLIGLQSAQVMSQSMPWIAQEAGLFKKYDLDFRLVFIPSSPVATAATLNGDAEIGVTGAVGNVRAYVQGFTDLVFIGGIKNFLTHSILGKPDIKRPEDLKGKKVAVGRFGGLTVEECYRYFLSQPVSVQVVGLASLDHLKTAVRIARDLNDQLGQQITALRMTLETLGTVTNHIKLSAQPPGWLLAWEATFDAEGAALSFGDQEEMGFGARVATPFTEKNGGTIIDDQVAAEETVPLEDQEYRQYLVHRALQVMQADFQPATWRACWEYVVANRPAAEVAAELNLSINAVHLAKARVLRRLREERIELRVRGIRPRKLDGWVIEVEAVDGDVRGSRALARRARRSERGGGTLSPGRILGQHVEKHVAVDENRHLPSPRVSRRISSVDIRTDPRPRRRSWSTWSRRGRSAPMRWSWSKRPRVRIYCASIAGTCAT